MPDDQNDDRKKQPPPDQSAAGKVKKKKKFSGSDSHSMVDLQIPNADLISPFQITDGENLVAASRTSSTQHPIRPSYIEGLQAINNEDLPDDMREGLQLDHSREYMERKFREWQQEQQDSPMDPQLLAHISEHGLPLPDDAGGTMAAVPAELAKRQDKEQFPYKGKEFTQLARCSQESSKAWKNAYSAFPRLKSTLPYKEGVRLMKALVLAELQFYKGKSVKRDEAAAQRHIPHHSLEALGFAQMSPKAVHELENGLFGGKQIRADAAAALKAFFSSKGLTGEGHEARVLLDPNCVPMLVAAKLDAVIELYLRSRDKFSAKPLRVDVRTVAYGYKPDVFFNPKDPGNPDFHAVNSAEQELSERLRGFELLYPCTQENVLRHSRHLPRVEYWLLRMNEPG